MTKPSNSSKAANKSAKDYFPGAGYREIGIAAVAAAVRCQHMAGPMTNAPPVIRTIRRGPIASRKSLSAGPAWAEADPLRTPLRACFA